MPRLPSVFTAPVHRLTPRQAQGFSGLTNAGLAAILLWGAWARFVWPQWPFANPDTWGYLHPGLAKLLGGTFDHTYGRNFVYPGWLYLLLKVTGDFRAIPIAAHVLGLATSALLWVIWRQWREWFADHTRLPAWADAVLGLGLVAFFARSASQIQYESQTRPESIFPFFTALEVYLLLAFVRAWFAEWRLERATVLAGLSLFNAALMYQIRPSFGLGVGVAALPVLWALASPWHQEARARLRLLGAVAVAGLAACVLLVLPERRLAQSDVLSTLFLPETLFTVHAGPIRDQMARDVREKAVTPFPSDWLAAASDRFDREVRRASEPAQKPYPTLGYNPDHLMYNGTSFCTWLHDQRPPEQEAAFCVYYYERAWTHLPGAMIANVFRQLGTFYSIHCPAFWPSAKLKVERYYRKTMDALSFPNYKQQLELYPPASAWLDAAGTLQTSPVEFRLRPILVASNVWASVGYLPMLVLFVGGMAWVSRWPEERRRGLWSAGWLLLILHGLTFGCCLTIAVVHSLDVDRYNLNLLVLAAPTLALEIAWLAELALAWLATRALPVKSTGARVIAAPTFTQD